MCCISVEHVCLLEPFLHLALRTPPQTTFLPVSSPVPSQPPSLDLPHLPNLLFQGVPQLRPRTSRPYQFPSFPSLLFIVIYNTVATMLLLLHTVQVLLCSRLCSASPFHSVKASSPYSSLPKPTPALPLHSLLTPLITLAFLLFVKQAGHTLTTGVLWGFLGLGGVFLEDFIFK